MSENEVKQYIRKDYSIHGNQKIWNIDMDNKTFQIMLGDCESIEIVFGKSLMRAIKLKQLGI